MKARLLLPIVAITGLLLLAVFGVVTTMMLRNAANTHAAIERMMQADQAVAELNRLRIAAMAAGEVKSRILQTGQMTLLAELDAKLDAAFKVLDETRQAAATNAPLARAFTDIGANYTTMLTDLRGLAAELASKRDPKAIAPVLSRAAVDPRFASSGLANANLATVTKMRSESNARAAAEFHGWEASAFWWLLVGGNVMLITIIGGAGLFILLIHDRKRVAAERAETLERMTAADISRSRFLAAASHDLRQPLQAVTLFTTALRRRVGDAYVTSLIDGVSSAVTSLERMFNGLLDISKLDAGIVAAERTDFAISRLLHNLEMEFSAIAGAKGLNFTVISDSAVVYTDPILLESMVRNIVANAVKYTKEGHVIVACRAEGRAVLIDVSDTGAGISEAEHDDIFQEFHRVGSSNGSEEGLGLGLAIVRRLSLLLGVGVTLQSIVGVGSTFTLCVPLSIGAAVPAALPVPAMRRATPVALRVLLVDDDALLRRAVAAELTDHGMSVTALQSPAEAMDLFQDPANLAAFDVALMDYNLGDGSNGVELLDRLAVQFGIALPALIMTGETDPTILEELGDSGYAWLPKPVESEVLINALSSLLAVSDQANAGVDNLVNALERSTHEAQQTVKVAVENGKAVVVS